MIQIKILRYVIILSLFFIISFLAYLQLVRGHYYFNLSQNNSIRVIPLEGRRGKILDRHGEILASNQLTFHVSVIPQDVQDLDMLVSFLSDELGLEEKTLHRRYKLKRISPFTPIILAERINRDQAIQIQESSFQYPGLTIQETFERVYPYKEKISHVLGYVSKINESKMRKLKEYGYTPQSNVGYSGLEEYYDFFLKGEFGGRQVEVDSRGKQIRLLGIKEPTVGEDLNITIDINIQTLAHDVLKDVTGAIVLMDVDSGEVLSMVSSPSYDNNDFIDRDRGQRRQSYFQDRSAPMINRAISANYPPGSVFKIPVALAGLETGKITPHTTFNCPGYLELGGHRFGCAHVHNDEDLIDMIKHSCNVYTYHLARMIGIEVIAKIAKDFGLGEQTDVDLSHEKTGKIPSRKTSRNWYLGNTLNTSIGQGDVTVTPIQLTQMMAAIANGGVLIKPQLSLAAEAKIQSADRIDLQSKNLDSVTEGMRLVVADASGTANLLSSVNYPIYGKTGTAQSGQEKRHHAWFSGFMKVPKSDQTTHAGKTIAFTVFIEHGGSSVNAVLKTRQLFMKMKARKLI